MAARSERLTRSIFRATRSGGSSGRKWTPATSASAVTTSCRPGGTSMSAASSASPNAPARPAASGRRWRAISSNSPGRLAGLAGSMRHRQLLRPQLAREAVEDSVDQARFLLAIERVGQIDIFADDDPGRYVRPIRKLMDARAQDAAKQGLQALDRPVLGQDRRDHVVEVAAAADDAAHQRDEEAGVRPGDPDAFHCLAQAVPGKLTDDLLGIAAGQLDLIEGLDGRQARRAASRAGMRAPCHQPAGRPRRRLSSIIARQARAASPPLSFSETLARAHACLPFSTVRMP